MDLSELERLETQQRRLKLSEAMRIGAKIRPQAKGCSARDGRTCAMFAAAEALGWKYHDNPNLKEALDLIERKTGVDFFAAGVPNILRLNDDENMTREQIADELAAQGY